MSPALFWGPTVLPDFRHGATLNLSTLNYFFMKKFLSWKLLLPLGALIWVIGKLFSDTFLGSACALLGLIILAMGVIAAVRAAIAKRKIS